MIYGEQQPNTVEYMPELNQTELTIEDVDGTSLVAFNLCVLEPNGSMRMKLVKGYDNGVEEYTENMIDFLEKYMYMSKQNLVNLVRSPFLLTMRNGDIVATCLEDPGVLNVTYSNKAAAAEHIASFYAEVEATKLRGIITVENTIVIDVYNDKLLNAPTFNMDMNSWDMYETTYFEPAERLLEELKDWYHKEVEGGYVQMPASQLMDGIDLQTTPMKQVEEELRRRYHEMASYDEYSMIE